MKLQTRSTPLTVLLAGVFLVVATAWPGYEVAAGQAAVAPPVVRRVNVPNITGQPFAPAILWLGKVDMTSNYADVRVWHGETSLKFVFHIPDRLLWYDSTPEPTNLTVWDAVSVYVDVAGNSGTTPGQTSYRFVKQLWGGNAANSKAAFKGSTAGWTLTPLSFTTGDGWRGEYPNDGTWDMGWLAELEIPFTSLGLTGAPAPGTTWGLGIAVHDRDDQAGTPIADQVWPEMLQGTRPETWGQLRFGRPVYTPPTSLVAGTTVVRHGLNGAVVTDAAVGGHTVCGEGMNAWTQWGFANYAGYTQFNIQNQWDVADFMCFSKYYVTFPMSAVPAGKSIVSARVTLHFFGNAGYSPADATPSAINALIVGEDWAEATISWNNAPYAVENTSVTWVNPVSEEHPAGGYDWDVSYAVAQAYATGQPLRLAFYSTDGDYHSGKYFWTSDSDDWGGTLKPTLEVRWGDAAAPARPRPPTNVRVIKEP